MNIEKRSPMKLVILALSITAGQFMSHAQNNFANLWTLQDSDDKIEIKIKNTSHTQKLSFVLEGLIDTTSRIFITGPLTNTGLNQYDYKDINSSCSIQFNFINKDSAFVKSNTCDLYTLNHSIEGLFTTNSAQFLTSKIFGKYSKEIEDEISFKTGQLYDEIISKSLVFNQKLTHEGDVYFFSDSKAGLNEDPSVVLFIKDNKVSIYFRNNDFINSFTSPYHTQMHPEVLKWIQIVRITNELPQ